MLKKLIVLTSIICLGLSLTSNAFAAIAATTQWEVRTTGAATNGGGYSSGGTDYSQQDAAQLSLTDLVNLSASTTLTSATGGFTSAMIGNIIYIASGTNFVVGYYQITAYTNTNTVTIDRTANATLDASVGVGKVGGAIDSPTTMQDGISTDNVIWIKAGTYSSTLTLATGSGGNGDKTRFVGYNTSRGDEPIGTNRPVLDGGSTRANCLLINGNFDQFSFENLRFENATGTGALGNGLSTENYFYNCKFASNGGLGLGGFGSVWWAINCEFNNNTTGGSEEGNLSLNCYIHDNTGYGIDAGSVVLSISESNGDDGIEIAHGGIVINCVAYNNTGAASDGIVFNSNTAYAGGIFYNNISSANGQYGFSQESGSPVPFVDYNLSYGHATEFNGFSYYNVDHNLAEADPLFTNAPGGDFTVGSGSPAIGTALDITTYTGTTGDYKVSVGVDQDDVTAAGGGGGAMGHFTVF